MGEFKFACPICGQHITSDASASGTQLECPTCFQKIVVPQAPAGDSKFILSAAQVDKPRPISEVGPGSSPIPASEASKLSIAAAIVVLLALAGAVFFLYKQKKWPFQAAAPPPQKQAEAAKAKHPVAPPRIYPIPTNILWTLDLTNADIPDAPVVGRLRGSGFSCERAILTGGTLLLRQGSGNPPDSAVSIKLFANLAEELSGKSVDVSADREPPLPVVSLRWKNADGKGASQNFKSGYVLKLTFGAPANGRLPGRIYVSLPDDAKSFAAGTFDAEMRKPPPPKKPKAKSPP